MLLSSQSDKELNGSVYAPNPVAVREQLKRLLAHQLFTNSKRYPVLLAYTVEQTLLGNASDLKERTIGIEAFGGEPSYDVNLDPVVRTTASEVRKRLIQYYYNTDHAGELIIELPLGSYVPAFREAVAGIQPEVASSQKIVFQDSLITEIAPTSAGRNLRQWMVITASLFAALVIGFGAGRIRFPTRPSDMERFWEPITATSSRVTY